MYRNESAGGRQAEDSLARAYLLQFLQENAASLQSIIGSYVAKMGLATGVTIEVVATEVFQDAALETLAHAESFNPNMQAQAWFLAIAANILKRHRATYAKRHRFEILVSILVHQRELESEQDILDQIMATSDGEPGPEQALLARESVREMLTLVSAKDAQLLNIAFIQEWDANALGLLMQITPGAARVRIHRALSRLREAWRNAEQRKEQYRG